MKDLRKLVSKMKDDQFDTFRSLLDLHTEYATNNGFMTLPKEKIDLLTPQELEEYEDSIWDAVIDEAGDIIHYHANIDTADVPKVNCGEEIWYLWECFCHDYEGNKKMLEKRVEKYG